MSKASYDDGFDGNNKASTFSLQKIKEYTFEIMNDVLVKSTINSGVFKFLLIIEHF
jgi:hypothetical protein